MVQIVVNEYDHAIFNFGTVERGLYPNMDPKAELYKITNPKGEVFYTTIPYMVIYEIDETLIPEEFWWYSYCPEEGFKRLPYAPKLDGETDTTENTNEDQSENTNDNSNENSNAYEEIPEPIPTSEPEPEPTLEEPKNPYVEP